MLEVANLIAVVGGDTTAHEVRQRARCHNCGVKGNNTYQIVYTGNSELRWMGLGLSVKLIVCGVNVWGKRVGKRQVNSEHGLYLYK